MLNNLESDIQKIIAESAATMAKQIAHAVRQTLAAEIMGKGTSANLNQPSAPKRLGRPPGSKSKTAPVTALPAAKTSPAAKASKGKRKRHAITQGELDVVLAVLAKKPNLTSVQIQKAAGIDGKQAARVLSKLRETKKVALKGERSKATYTVA